MRDGIAIRVVLTAGLEERDFIECRNLGESGLNPGDRIVVSGQQMLEDQTQVEISEN